VLNAIGLELDELIEVRMRSASTSIFGFARCAISASVF
jgi:hypothetical protein